MLSSSTNIESAIGNPADKLATFIETAKKQRPKLLLLAWRITSRREDAEDIVQEALLRAFRALPRFRGDSRMGTWLHVIVHNAALEYLRSRRGTVELPLEPLHAENEDSFRPEFPDPAKTPEEFCERRELVEVLHSSLKEVTSLNRSAIQMCILQELPLSSVASDLNVSKGTLKSRVFHGKRMLKTAVRRRMRQEDNLIAAGPIKGCEGA